MSHDNIISSIQYIVRDVLDDESLNIGANTSVADVEGWDSLAHINILSQIESEFGVRFSLDEIANFSAVGNIAKAVQQKSS